MKKTKVEVLPPAETLEADLARALTQEYDAAQRHMKAGVEAALKFGALLLKTEEVVFANGKSHNQHSTNGGLEAWLGKNCPNVNYKTAMRWKAIAAQATGALGCDQQTAIAMISGDLKAVPEGAPVWALQSRVDEMMSAGSLRKLSQMCFDFASESAAGGRPKAPDKPLPKLKKSDEAKAIWNGVLQVLSKNAVKDSIPLLGAVETQIALDKLSQMAKLLKDHYAEF